MNLCVDAVYIIEERKLPLKKWEFFSALENKPFCGFCGFMSEQDVLFERLARERNITVEEMKGIKGGRSGGCVKIVIKKAYQV